MSLVKKVLTIVNDRRTVATTCTLSRSCEHGVLHVRHRPGHWGCQSLTGLAPGCGMDPLSAAEEYPAADWVITKSGVQVCATLSELIVCARSKTDAVG